MMRTIEHVLFLAAVLALAYVLFINTGQHTISVGFPAVTPSAAGK
jgi:hypothetical protein